ncbi:MAG TPA: hypothetical protein VMW24_22030, partial [Sedimentisphaerales bacterium]|nr:hypothetical protein [Sedimentisphaerales bacterium]
MADTQEAKVDTPCSQYVAMSRHWPLIDDLLSGSQAMRDNRTAYLPKFDKEKDKHYDARVENSTLFSAYADTAKTMISKPFGKPVVIQGELPDQLADLANDVDGRGKTLMQLARELFGHFVNRGIAHILVDYPVTAEPDGATPNLGAERSAGFRPRFIAVSPDDLIGWQSENAAGGRPVLSRIRIVETQVEPDGMWGDKIVHYVRVIEPEAWSLWRKVEDDYVEVENGINSLG